MSTKSGLTNHSDAGATTKRHHPREHGACPGSSRQSWWPIGVPNTLMPCSTVSNSEPRHTLWGPPEQLLSATCHMPVAFVLLSSKRGFPLRGPEFSSVPTMHVAPNCATLPLSQVWKPNTSHPRFLIFLVRIQSSLHCFKGCMLANTEEQLHLRVDSPPKRLHNNWNGCERVSDDTDSSSCQRGGRASPSGARSCCSHGRCKPCSPGGVDLDG